MLAALLATLALAAPQPTFLMPAWSPDGSRIAWAQGAGPAWEVWTASADGSSAARVGPPIDALFQVAWASPDELLTAANYRLSRVRLDGTRTDFGDGIDVVVDASRSLAAWQSADLCPLVSRPAPRPAAGRRPGRQARRRCAERVPDLLAGRQARRVLALLRGRRALRACGRNLDGAVRRRRAEAGRRGPAAARAGLRTERASPTATARASGSSRRPADAPRCFSARGKEHACVPGHGRPTRAIALPAADGRLIAVAVPSGRVRALTGRAQGTITGFSWSPDSTLLVTARTKPHCSALWLVGSTSRKLRGC